MRALPPLMCDVCARSIGDAGATRRSGIFAIGEALKVNEVLTSLR